MNEERIKEVFADEEFVKELLSKETPEEAQALLAEKDIDISVEDLVNAKDIVVSKLQQKENGESAELTEEELKDISGGCWPVIVTMILGIVAVVGATAWAVTKENNIRW